MVQSLGNSNHSCSQYSTSHSCPLDKDDIKKENISTRHTVTINTQLSQTMPLFPTPCICKSYRRPIKPVQNFVCPNKSQVYGTRYTTHKTLFHFTSRVHSSTYSNSFRKTHANGHIYFLRIWNTIHDTQNTFPFHIESTFFNLFQFFRKNSCQWPHILFEINAQLTRALNYFFFPFFFFFIKK